MGRAVKNSLEIIIKRVRLEGGFERGGRIRKTTILKLFFFFFFVVVVISLVNRHDCLDVWLTGSEPPAMSSFSSVGNNHNHHFDYSATIIVHYVCSLSSQPAVRKAFSHGKADTGSLACEACDTYLSVVSINLVGVDSVGEVHNLRLPAVGSGHQIRIATGRILPNVDTG